MGNFPGGQEEPPYEDTSDSGDDIPMHEYMIPRRVAGGNMIQMDASYASRNSANNLNISTSNFELYTLSDELLSKIENKLEEYEKVSLAYFLFDGVEALRQMKKVLNEADANILNEFFKNNKSDPAKLKFVEALCVIQNYGLLKDLGHTNRRELQQRFNPQVKGVSSYINKFKKYIYKLFDNMEVGQYDRFFELVKDDFTSFKKFKYFEMSFAHFEKFDYISEFHLPNLLKHLKVLELDSDYGYLSNMHTQESNRTLLENLNVSDEDNRPNMIADKAADLNLPSTSRQHFRPTATVTRSMDDGNECYLINPSCPGVFLLIENKTFYSEFDKRLQDQVLQKKIEERKGTEFDSDRILRFFKKYGYKCIYKKDLTHLETIQAIEEVVNNMMGEESSFYTCFLSHGERGKIIACNNIAVPIDDIKAAMISPKLRGKPKVLILQSCQGDVIQSVPIRNHGLTTDGASIVPQVDTADFIEIYSTVPGYASIRNINEGTWFIQSLCEILENNSNENLLDICTKTNYLVGQKSWKDEESGREYIMTCMNSNTLRKKLYLIP